MVTNIFLGRCERCVLPVKPEDKHETYIITPPGDPSNMEDELLELGALAILTKVMDHVLQGLGNMMSHIYG